MLILYQIKHLEKKRDKNKNVNKKLDDCSDQGALNCTKKKKSL